MTIRILTGDCREHMAAMDEASVDAIVTDPPYALTNRVPDVKKCRDCGRVLGGRDGSPESCPKCGGELYNQRSQGKGFMGKDWDGAIPGIEIWQEAYRVAKPGAHLLAFGGTRTHHRLMVAIEDAGFEIRDCLMYLYGSGFPKSHNLNGDWQGWGTALKPSYEPVIMARKPLAGTVAQNVERYGTGAINVDGCRIGTEEISAHGGGINGSGRTYGMGAGIPAMERGANPHIGRWPANVLLDEDAAALLDQMSGETSSTGKRSTRSQDRDVPGTSWGNTNHKSVEYPGDTGGASRFFYTAKASSAERNRGLDGMPVKRVRQSGHVDERVWDIPGSHATRRANHHPTVKPLDLMQWLVRLVTPRGGVVLDPFMGSGSTMVAADREGFDGIGIELDPEYVEIAKRRVYGDAPMFAQVAAD